MKNIISDQDFCREINLSAKDTPKFKQLLAKNDFTQAALHVARCAFAKPFAHPIREQDIPALSDLIRKEVPDQIKILENLANKYWLKEAQAVPTDATAYDQFHYHIPNTQQRTRGIGVYTLSRLFHLTGNKKYLRGAMDMMHEIGAQHGDYPSGSPVGFYAWHPYTFQRSYSHTIAHIAQEFNLMLPFIRDHISDEDKLYLMKLQWTVADLAYRAFNKDQSFNLTLHFVTACHQCALLFPQFKAAKTWIKWARFSLQEFYQGNGVTADGYFREGVLYQRVNHHLMELNSHFMQATKQVVPKKMLDLIHAAHQLNADICGPDGFPPLIGDSAPTNPHEHWIHTHEALHLAAALENNRSYKDKAGTPIYRKPHERNLWDMGLTGLKRYLKMPCIADKDRAQKPADHGNSGFQILGSGKHNDQHFGALLYTQNHNHSHFDVGSIHLFSKGRSLISDASKASYGTYDNKDEAPQSHNLAILPRFSPAGPRLHSQQWAKTKFVQHQKSWQAASMEHKLYDGFRMQRTLALVENKNKGEDHSFWLVFDKISSDHPHPLGLHELVDTSFHFNAPETQLGMHGLQCWSQHQSSKTTATRFKETDTACAGPGQLFNIQEYRQSFEFSDSNANIQVAGFSLLGVEFSLEPSSSHTCEFGGRVKRPAALFRYRGPLPAVLAYVLVPFNGVSSSAPLSIDGSLDKQSFECTVQGRAFRIQNPFTKNMQVQH